MITPRLVRPTNAEALATPLDGAVLPTESDLFLFGKTTSGTAVPGGPKGGIDGPHGYILE